MTESAERILPCTTTVDADQVTVWEAWTTEAGLTAFFAPACRLELEPGGAYELYFHPDRDPGQRGAEGTTLLAIQPPSMLSFTWNFPQRFESLARQRTAVVVRLTPLTPTRTEVRLVQFGWGEGGPWEAAFDYFETAWEDGVLSNLQTYLEEGPIEWER